jgi:HlyD family secretion protein
MSGWGGCKVRNILRKVAVWLLVTALLAGGGWWWWHRSRATQAQPSFVTVTVRRGDLVLTVEGSGPVQPAESTVVRTAVGGTVAEVLVKEGQRVRAGDILVRLDDSSARTALEQARVDLESARVRLESMRRAPTEAELASARAAVTAAEAQLAQLKDEQSALEVVSPGNGRILECAVAVGDEVTPGMLLCRVADLSHLKAVFSVDQVHARYVEPGDFVDVSVSAIKGNLVHCQVESVAQEAASGYFQVTVALPDTEGLMPGMKATMTFNGSWGLASASGQIQAADEWQVKSRVAGKVGTLAVKEGDSVKAGQLLMRLENTTLSGQIAQAEAQVKSAREELDRLLTSGTVAKSEDIATQELAVERARLAVSEREQALADLVIRAPCDGVVTKLGPSAGSSGSAGSTTATSGGTASGLRPGDRLTAGAEVATISNYSSYQIEVPVDELDVARLRVGMPAQVTVAALGQKVLSGRVTQVALEGVVKDGITTYPVTVVVDPVPGLKVGMNADVRIEVERREGVLYLPIEAVHSQGGRQVVTVLEGGQPRPVAVETGLRTETAVEIRQGLEEGQAVVISARTTQQGARPGMFFFPGPGTRPGQSQPRAREQSAPGGGR